MVFKTYINYYSKRTRRRLRLYGSAIWQCCLYDDGFVRINLECQNMFYRSYFEYSRERRRRQRVYIYYSNAHNIIYPFPFTLLHASSSLFLSLFFSPNTVIAGETENVPFAMQLLYYRSYSTGAHSFTVYVHCFNITCVSATTRPGRQMCVFYYSFRRSGTLFHGQSSGRILYVLLCI